MRRIPEPHYSAGELAGLPGLPTTERAIQIRAQRESWPRRRRPGRGGGWEYPESALPPQARAELARRAASETARAGRLEAKKLALSHEIDARARTARAETTLKSLGAATDWRGAYIDATLAILGAFRAFHARVGGPIVPARVKFAEAYAAGEIEIDPAVRDRIPSFSSATLTRWERRVAKEGLAGAARRYGNREGDGKIDRQPRLREFIEAMLVEHPNASSSHVMQAIRARFNGHSSLDYPSYRSLQRWLVRWKEEHRQAFAAATNPDTWKSRHMAAFGSASEEIERLNQRWEMDSTPGDIMLTDGRHAVIGVIDVYSRRAMLRVEKTSRAAGIAALLRRALLDWGVPEEAKTDNGSDYTSRHITRVFAELDVYQVLCPPFQPWRKPHIERFFRTFSHDLVELLAGFLGHNVAERQAIEARASFAERLMSRDGVLEVKMSSAEFQRFCDRWCADIYAHRAHEGLQGRTPFEAASAWRGVIRAIEDERALDVLLAEPAGGGRRTVGKKGIRLDGAWFVAPELALHIGEEVEVRCDPQDLGRIVVRSLDGTRFLCIAEAPERTGMDRREVAAKARELQRARVQEERRALKAAAKRLKTDDIVEEILIERAQAAGKLVPLPAKAAPHRSAGIEAAAEAARALGAPPQVAPVPALDAQARFEAEFEAAANVVSIHHLAQPNERYAFWKLLARRREAGRSIEPEHAAWMGEYERSREWRSMRGLDEEFGLDPALELPGPFLRLYAEGAA